MRKIFRIYPALDAFEINGVFVPYVDVLADDAESALRAAHKLMPGFDGETGPNTLNFIEQL